MTMRFDDDQRRRVLEAVHAAEANTSGEIVPLVVDASDAYPHVALAGSLAGLWLAAFVWLWLPYSWQPLPLTLSLAVGMVLGYLVARHVPRVRRFLIGPKVAAEEVHQRAIQAFLEHGLTETRDRTGVLILVSFLERRVEVLADVGINKKVGPDAWPEVVGLILAGVRRGSLVDGLTAGIARCGAILAEHFPIRPDDVNELPDDLIHEPR